MKLFKLYIVLIIGILSNSALSLPQRNRMPPNGNIFFPGDQIQDPFQAGNLNNNQVGVQQTTPATNMDETPPTTPSPAFLACMRRCPMTSEYNPICATDNQNYHNRSRLNCAIRCGQNIAAVRGGTCAPL